MLLEQAHHGERGEARHERRTLLPDVAAIDNGRHDRRIGRRPADAELLEAADELGLGVAGGRVRAVALWRERRGCHGLALAKVRQLALAICVVRILGDVLESGVEPREDGDGAGRGELDVGAIGAGGPELHGRGRNLRIDHLRCDRALPDEVVERELIGIQLARNLARGTERIACRPDRLMGLLSVLHLLVVPARKLRDVLGAVERRRLRTGRIDRLLRQVCGVGAHVGDVAVLVQPLRHAHRALGAPTQAVRGLLLE